uniref:Uncharacterized protein n=1 Tax=Neovison vison TaxID=452646 RepID=A0A8C7ETK8_NEOVI
DAKYQAWEAFSSATILPLCLVQRTDQARVLKKIEKFHSLLMRLLGTKEPCTVAMETD